MIDDSDWRDAGTRLADLIRRAAKLALKETIADSRDGITILFTSDATLRRLNLRHRGKDKPTNVLSFPAAAGANYLGDVAIAFGVTKAEAKAAGKPLADHAIHLAVHGVLHLLGYDHQTGRDAAKMERLEIAILAKMGIPNPYERRKVMLV